MVTARASAPDATTTADDPVLQVPATAVQWPRRAPEVELVGRMQDVAFDDQWLICYDGEHYIQATPLLYHVLLYADGITPLDQIAAKVAESTGADVTAEQIEWLILNRLATSGLLDLSGTTTDPASASSHPTTPTPRLAEMPVLGIRWRIPLLPYRLSVPVANVLQHLFWPPLMLATVIAAIGINVWVFLDTALLRSIEAVFYQPELVLLVIGLDLLSALFHEFGHAAALRRAGARYGWIGFAVYIIFPVLYTDVTHVYRLGRRDRLRVDLGGMYFQLIATIVFWWLFHLTDSGVFLIAIILTTLSFLRQFTPFLRFDGYYTIADIMGVHEPLSLVGPFIRDNFPWPRNKQRRLPQMRRSARLAFSAYLLLVAAFLAYPILIGTFVGREFVSQLAQSGSLFWNQFLTAWGDGDLVLGILATFQLLTWVIIPLGLTLMAMMLARHFSRAGIALGSFVWRRFLRRGHVAEAERTTSA